MLLSAGVAPAAAQAVEATRPDAPLHAGPLQLFPTFTIRDIGIDSNVYNDSQVPREDFTYTVSPTLRAVLPIGASRLTTRGGLDFRYFQRLKDQQSTSGWLNAQLEIGVRPRAPLRHRGPGAQPRARRLRRGHARAQRGHAGQGRRVASR